MIEYNFPNRFPDLFAAIEKKKTETKGIGIDSYGVSMTTLEEIFLKLGAEEEAKKLAEENRSKVGKVILYLAFTFTFFNGMHLQKNGIDNGTFTRVTVDAAKDLGGFSFEAVETRKSAWQIFKVRVRTFFMEDLCLVNEFIILLLGSPVHQLGPKVPRRNVLLRAVLLPGTLPLHRPRHCQHQHLRRRTGKPLLPA